MQRAIAVDCFGSSRKKKRLLFMRSTVASSPRPHSEYRGSRGWKRGKETNNSAWRGAIQSGPDTGEGIKTGLGSLININDILLCCC